MADNFTLPAVGTIIKSLEGASSAHRQIIAQPQTTSSDNTTTISGATTDRSITVSTTTGSKVITSAALFTSADVGRVITGTGIPANAIIVTFTSTSSVTFQAAPDYANDNPDPTATATGSPTATIIPGYAGTYELTESMSIVRELVVLSSNVSSGLGGTFCFQYSTDGSTSIISEVRAISDFETVRDFDLLNAGAYFRVMFAPDRELTSGESVYITTTLREQNDGAFVRLANQQTEESNAAMSQAFAYLKAFVESTGKSANVRANERGNLLIADYNIEVARGTITGVSAVRVTGRNASVGTTEQVLNGTGGALPFLTAATTVRVKSGGNAADDASGAGAREVTVVGVDGTGAVVSETIATAGASASSSTTATFLRINDFYVSQTGTYSTGAIATGANTGAISLETTGGTLLAVIPANLGRAARALYAVPLGKTAYFRRVRVTPEGSKSVTFRLWTRKSYTDATAPMPSKLLRAEWTLATATDGFELVHPFQLEALEEIWVSAKTGTGSSEASAAFELLIVDD